MSLKLDRINRLNNIVRNNIAQNYQPRMPNNAQIPLIDKFYPRPNQVKIYVDDNNFPFSATYSFSNLENNTNRFYIMQILQ